MASPKQVRKRPGTVEESDVLVASRRRCAFCFGLDGDLAEKRGQLAHIDQNPSNSKKTNLAFLCQLHHDLYDSRSRQTKGYTAAELRHYRAKLYALVKNSPVETWQSVSASGRRRTTTNSASKSVEQYDRRKAIYDIARSFIGRVVRNANPQFNEIVSFVHAVDEATFLFDDSVYSYLNELYRKALRLRFVLSEMASPRAENSISALALEESELLVWFTEQFNELKSRFTPFLRWQ